MNYKKLSEIASIHSGLVLSRKEAKAHSEKAIEYRRLNLRSINDSGDIDLKSLDNFFSDEKLNEQFMTAKDDIIMRLFAPFNPVLITEESAELLVPSQLAIIRIKTNEKILPAFLVQYLSLPEAASFIASQDAGQTIRSIKISTLANIKVPLPDLKKQQLIAAFVEINAKRKSLYMDLINQYDVQVNTIINKIIGGK